MSPSSDKNACFEAQSFFDTAIARFYISAMRSAVRLALSAVLLLAGCSSQIVPRPETAEESQLFGPVSMKFDSFSKVKDWSGRGAPDGVEALVEFDDRFGDRTKAAGTILFEFVRISHGVARSERGAAGQSVDGVVDEF